MVHKTKIRVRYAETDQMGIVYYANYYIWFEVGRTEYLADIGCRYTEMEENGILLPVRTSSCTYKVSAHYDDELVIETRVTKLKGARIVFEYKVYRDDVLITEGSTEHAFMDREGNLIKVNKHPMLQKLLSEHGLL